MKHNNTKLTPLIEKAIEDSAIIKHKGMALRKFYLGNLGFNTITKHLKKRFNIDCGLFDVAKEIPVNINDLRNVLKVTDNVPCNSDQRASIVAIHNLLNK